MEAPLMDPQAATMGPPGPAALARRSLADYYDNEVANTLELARNAHEGGMKSSFRNLLQMATRNRKFAEQARRHEKLQTILGQLANGAPSMPGVMPQPSQSVDPMNPMAPNLQPEVPAYAHGGAHPGGAALVGEEGPEVVDLPAGSTVHPNPAPAGLGGNPLLMVIRTLLDELEATQGGGMGLPAQDGAGMPAYAYGTPNTRGGGDYGRPARRSGGGGGIGTPYQAPYQQPAAPAPYTPDRYGAPGTMQRQDFVGPNGQFNANQGLQANQLRNLEAGNFDPLGSEAAAQISKQTILGGMGARQEQSAKLADIYAQGDPSFRAYARLKAGADTQSEAARAYEQSRAQQMASAQGFGRDVYLNQLGAVTRKDPKEGNPLAQIGGQVAGTALGALVGGPAGAAVGGKLGGGTNARQVEPEWWG